MTSFKGEYRQEIMAIWREYHSRQIDQKKLDKRICEIIKRVAGTLRARYYQEIVRGDFIKPLGYINSVIDGGF